MDMSIIEKKGRKRSGYAKGLLGIIGKCDWEGFEHLYSITFSNGSSVIASKNDIEIKE